MPGRVVVVGAGLGGLSAAVRLAAAGARVTLLEREARPGGRAGRFDRDGYAFDTGPSVLTMPGLVAELFARAGEDMGEHLPVRRLDPAYRASFHDGSVLCVRGGVDAMEQEVREVCGPREAARFRGFAEHLRRLYRLEYPTFIDRNFHSPLDLVRPQLAVLARLGGLRRLHPLVSSHLRDWRLRRLFTFQAMYAGMSPFRALGVYAVIAYMDTVAGVYFTPGGIHRLPTELAALASRVGVDLRYRSTVERVEVRGGRATGVRTTDGAFVPADVVVVNPDLPAAYRDLLPAAATPPRVRRLRYSPSCVVVHLGLDRRLRGAEHHNIHFARDYRESFDDLLAGRLQRDPSWFLTVPTRDDPGLAPPGGEVGFHLLPAPNRQGVAATQIDWDAQAPRELLAAQGRMEAAGYGPVRDATRVAEVVTPADWERRGMAAGTPFAASHTLGQTGPFRPRNVAPRVDGVVFVGSGTTPGVGVPMVLVSGRLAAERAVAMLGSAARWPPRAAWAGPRAWAGQTA
ncbi:MAG: phytoene desaturase family protein [Actinomycetota bacterium]|nr:phytoene desaturase family protein [Actinomycetota bacterium]